MPLDSVSQFIAEIEGLKHKAVSSNKQSDFIFRGQRRDKPLLPVLERIVPKGERENIEQLMFQEFKRTCPSLIGAAPQTDWDYLSLAQHHGMPTRFLDWTKSALAALWFTVEKAPYKNEQGVVWGLRTEVEDFVDENEHESPFAAGRTKIYRPRLINNRIAAQGGLFTVHRMSKEEGFVPLEKNKWMRERLTKICIPSTSFSRIRSSLYACGVDRFALFPDLVGLCGHLTWRYAKLRDELPPGRPSSE